MKSFARCFRETAKTQGRGSFTMEFDRYSEVPAGMVDKMMEKEGR